MSDSEGHRRDETAPGEKPWKKDTKNVPPLVWMILGALVIIIALIFLFSKMSNGGDEGLAPGQPAASEAAAPAAGG
jgi:hypothetical protein